MLARIQQYRDENAFLWEFKVVGDNNCVKLQQPNRTLYIDVTYDGPFVTVKSRGWKFTTVDYENWYENERPCDTKYVMRRLFDLQDYPTYEAISAVKQAIGGSTIGQYSHRNSYHGEKIFYIYPNHISAAYFGPALIQIGEKYRSYSEYKEFAGRLPRERTLDDLIAKLQADRDALRKKYPEMAAHGFPINDNLEKLFTADVVNHTVCRAINDIVKLAQIVSQLPQPIAEEIIPHLQ